MIEVHLEYIACQSIKDQIKSKQLIINSFEDIPTDIELIFDIVLIITYFQIQSRPLIFNCLWI